MQSGLLQCLLLRTTRTTYYHHSSAQDSTSYVTSVTYSGATLPAIFRGKHPQKAIYAIEYGPGKNGCLLCSCSPGSVSPGLTMTTGFVQITNLTMK